MKKILTEKIVSTRSYAENIACSVIAYAQKNDSFKTWVLHTLQKSNTGKGYSPEENYKNSFQSATLLFPRDESIAVRRVEWLLHLPRHLPNTSLAIQLLTSWSQERAVTSPSFIVLGLKAGVLNYGIFGHPSKRNEPLDIIIRNDVAQGSSQATVTQTCAELVASVIENALIQANGNTKHLEPELADWLFGDKQIMLYRAEKKILENISQEMNNINVSYTSKNDPKGLSFLTVPPSLYLQDFTEFENLEKL